jgi:long-chain acyl-CoA synthetase
LSGDGLPMPATVLDLFLDAASRVPDRPAVVRAGRSITFAELHRAQRSLAGTLRGLGVQPADRLLLVSDNSIGYVIGLLGAWSAGAVVVPLPPDTRDADMIAMAATIGARLVLASPTVARGFGTTPDGLAVVVLSEDVPPADDSAAGGQPDGADLAMVLRTSGTTSAPKAVKLTHANLAANVTAVIASLALTADDSVLAVLPFFYSYGNSILLTHLAVGATVIIEPRFAFPEAVVQALAEHRPTGFYGVPTTYYVLFSRTTFPTRDWTSLRYVAQAGGAMRVETIEKLRAILPLGSVYIMYGQTEATARLTVLPPDSLVDRMGSVGRPIAGTTIEVRDPQGRAVATGQVGELVARGPGIMQGYFEDPEATTAVLCDGWLATGDVGYCDADGFVWVVGRQSDFIKSGGIRIAPSEVEAVVAEVEGVEEVAAFGLDDELLGQTVAVSIVAGRHEPDPADIRAHCANRLATAKIPRQIFFDASLPKTPSGKTRYGALRERHRPSGRPGRDAGIP